MGMNVIIFIFFNLDIAQSKHDRAFSTFHHLSITESFKKHKHVINIMHITKDIITI